jgi:hypothetical protein
MYRPVRETGSAFWLMRPLGSHDARANEKGAGRVTGAVPRDLLRCLLAVLLNARGAQAGQAMLVDGHLPAQEFLGGQRVTLAGLLEAEQTAADGGDNLGFAANNPASGAGRWKVGNRQGTAVGPNDILDPWAVGFGHDTLTQKFNDL